MATNPGGFFKTVLKGARSNPITNPLGRSVPVFSGNNRVDLFFLAHGHFEREGVGGEMRGGGSKAAKTIIPKGDDGGRALKSSENNVGGGVGGSKEIKPSMNIPYLSKEENLILKKAAETSDFNGFTDKAGLNKFAGEIGMDANKLVEEIKRISTLVMAVAYINGMKKRKELKLKSGGVGGSMTEYAKTDNGLLTEPTTPTRIKFNKEDVEKVNQAMDEAGKKARLKSQEFLYPFCLNRRKQPPKV